MNNDILILDDTDQFQSEHRQRLRDLPAAKEFNLPEVTVKQFEDDLITLRKRAQDNGNSKDDRETCFDRAAILFVDYRLIDLKLAGFFTGEVVAYLARCFSRCGFIVGVNQFGDKTFDLSLCGHPESFADLNIGAEDIENPGLWKNGWSGFRPWYWPLLPYAYNSLEQRVAELTDLDASIFDFLGLTSEQVATLPRGVLEFLTKGNVADAQKTTFREFVTQSGSGLARKEKTTDEFQRRVAATRLGKWLDRYLLGGQNTLVDAPHLVTRFPSLLNNATEIRTLDATAQLVPARELPLKLDLIAKYQFGKTEWLSRPAWFWEALKDDPVISEVASPWKREDFPFRFCEDISRFQAPDDCKEFVANLPSPFTRRYVKRLDGVEYIPELRFSM